jgi:coenzyme PQQ precursor peptide PqqA
MAEGIQSVENRLRISISPRRITAIPTQGGFGIMEWTTPSFEEVSLNCEVSSYASAEL